MKLRMNTIGLLVSLSCMFFSQQGYSQGMSLLGNPSRYDRVKTVIKDIVNKYPNQASIINLGVSDSGESILGLRIGAGSVHQLVVATHHGNEYGSTEVALSFALHVVENPIPDVTMFVVPVLNISGYNSNVRWERGSDGKNHDPNRDYPGPCGTEGPFKLKSTKALAKFVEENNIVASATLHTFSPAVLYPWGLDLTNLSTAYNQEYVDISNIAASHSHYKVGNSTELLYPCNGAFEDYAFWKHGVWSLLFELGYSHSPNTNDVKQLVEENVPGLYDLFRSVQKTKAPDHEVHSSCAMRNLLFLDRHDE